MEHINILFFIENFYLLNTYWQKTANG